MTIEYKKMSLFDAPEGSIIVHACNAQGVWGSGIAKEFKIRYPEQFKYYEQRCKDDYYGPALGTGQLSPGRINPHYVGWIITSENYGSKKDGYSEILANTALALYDLCKAVIQHRRLNNWEKIDVYSNKFNSGLFAVSWVESEIVLKEVLKHFPSINWIVCSQNDN